MKTIWCTIWILSALLVVATVDAQPDPPALNPSTAYPMAPGAGSASAIPAKRTEFTGS